MKQNKEISALYGELISKLFNRIGIVSVEDANSFFSPKYEDLYDPFLILDMQKSVDRVYKAVKNDEKVLVYSDYDCDGIPGAVLLIDLFKKIGFKNFENYIPDRHKEGYGLNDEYVDFIIENKFDLVITIDLGIAEIDRISKIQKSKIDVIIIDHHEQHANLPQAFAVIDPKRMDDTYPFKGLCACGLVYKFIQAFLSKHRDEFNVPKDFEKWWMDLVAISTIADQVPLVSENRILAFYGLKVLRKTKRHGLDALFNLAKINKSNFAEEDISFGIAPRINVASRMAHPQRAFDLLSSDSNGDSSQIANELEDLNKQRKTIVTTIVKEANKMADEMTDDKILFLGKPTWRIGILGLVATKLSEKYGKSVFVWGREGDGEIKGSARSIGDVHLVEIMEKIKDCFLGYGGHEMAGGFSVEPSKIHEIRERINKVYVPREKTENKNEEFFNLEISDIGYKLYDELNRFAPFGMNNLKPVFKINNVVVESINMFGKNKEHIRVKIKQDGKPFSGFQFFKNAESFSRKFQIGDKVSIIANLEKSSFDYKLELKIIDIV